MTEHDLGGFTTVMKQLAAVFRRRPDTEEFRALTGSYFRALSRHELPELQRAADGWIATEAKFPTPYELRRAIPRRVRDLRTMSITEGRDYAAAEHAGYEGDCCTCPSCVEADVTDKPLRFVPEADEHDMDFLVNDPIRKRSVVSGHWAHGWELARWYVAKDAFWARCEELGLRGLVKKAIAGRDTRGPHHKSDFGPLTGREPGQEG